MQEGRAGGFVAHTHSLQHTCASLSPAHHRISYTGQQFAELTEPQQQHALDTLAVLSRVEPLHKLKLVEMLKKQVGVA